MNWIKKLFGKKEGRIFDMTSGSGWGNVVHFDRNGIDVHGWLTPLPKKGDVILVRMKSGKVGKYIFTQVKPCGNPRDMFFGKVTGVGYVEPRNFNKINLAKAK